MLRRTFWTTAALGTGGWARAVAIITSCGLLLNGCSEEADDGRLPGSGGQAGVGGNSTGGANSGGNSSGGSATGGASSGGASTGGGTTGGSSAGGSSSGGSAAGGSDTAGSGGGSGDGGYGPGSGVTIDGPRIILDGRDFRIRGVNWNPVPRGGVHPQDLDFSGFADQDIALMQEAGINAVRTYERLEDRAVLDKLYEAGIYVFSTVYGYYQDDPNVVVERVNAVKDHPAILAWVIGNEWNYNQLYADGAISTEEARALLNQAAALIQAEDDSHPVATIYGELGGLAETIAAMPDVDLWGINTYRGISHGDLFSEWSAVSNLPMFLGEYGADAYNATLPGYDPESQAEATSALTQEIIDNYVTDTSGVTTGGFLFEFADEWWKDGAGSPDVQDVGGIAPGGGPHPDQTFNEEYWGIVDIDRVPRPAYTALQELYRP